MLVKVEMFDRGKNLRWFKKVEGRAISFTGFTEFKFILHRSPEKDDSLWRVSEATTGTWFAGGATPNKVLQKAKNRLLDIGRESLRTCILKQKEINKKIPLKGAKTE